jgi:hypothetical protein
MALVIRHGGEAHVMRPDGVYRTSVIRPFVNYSPQADVQAVAQQFTQGGPLATQLSGFGQPFPMQMNGFGHLFPGMMHGFGNNAPGPLKRWWMGVKARFAARNGLVPMGNGGGGPFDSNQGPSTDLIVASQVAPQMQAQMSMLEHMMRNANPNHIQRAVAAGAQTLSYRRPFTYYRAG